MTDFAAAWDKWFPVIEGGARPVTAHMIERAHLAPGHRVLDIATGIGEPALSAAQRVAPGGEVLAVDLSAEMIARARERARASGIENIRFEQLDGEALALEPQSFDAVFCRWGFMFLRDLPGLLARLHDTLVPGGRLVAVVWGPADQAPAVGLAARAAHRFLDRGHPDEGPLTPFALADVEAFQDTLRQSGFAAVSGEWLDVVYTFDSTAAYVTFRADCSVALQTLLKDLTQARREAALVAVGEAAQDYAMKDGRIRMVNRCFCAVAERGTTSL